MDNTVGSLGSLLTNPEDAYILGLWGADRYLRTSSIGLSNTNLTLLYRSLDFLLERFPKERVRVRIYGNEIPKRFEGFKKSFCKCSKNVSMAYHVYVNSRPLVREFLYSLSNRKHLAKECIYPYFAGRFDGDGSISPEGTFCRIVYGDSTELSLDRSLLTGINTSVYRYSAAGTYCLYFSKSTLSKFLEGIGKYSISGKLQ
ncbi:hypothetical protein GF360_00370 [candidate division WWE3 bacterium]|nr:hypothetical protein [candidate division WWE3 bacterium]